MLGDTEASTILSELGGDIHPLDGVNVGPFDDRLGRSEEGRDSGLAEAEEFPKAVEVTVALRTEPFQHESGVSPRRRWNLGHRWIDLILGWLDEWPGEPPRCPPAQDLPDAAVRETRLGMTPRVEVGFHDDRSLIILAREAFPVDG
ncbi:MAG TPA: hypothetical protein VM534_08195 [Thermoanaerobaculia bacterium]|nr:hypothetical protein [Thermoanaerobaculia bacterium]